MLADLGMVGERYRRIKKTPISFSRKLGPAKQHQTI